jgi:uncharacterized cupredoxin-like copper-binding protein
MPMLLVTVAALALAACTGDGGATADDGGGATTVGVTLQEWAVLPDAESAPAGQVTFEVTNDGPEDVHEFVVIRTDLAPTDLPTDETGTVDEAGEGMEVVDEIEDIPVGETQELTVDLDAGSYVLVCNIYSEDEQEAHYSMGMATAFSVTD